MPLVTAEQLREKLQWEGVREEQVPEYGMKLYRVLPTEASLRSIDFLFDDGVSLLHQLGSGNWHYHPATLDDAIQVAYRFVHRELCILEECNGKGECSGSSLVAPGGIAGTLRLDVDHFVRRFFGSPEVRETIDFSRYYREKRLYIELNHKTEAEKYWNSIGAPIPEW